MDTQVITSPSGKAMKELLIQHKEALNFLHPGDIIEGRVLAKSSKRLFLDLDYFKPGIVYKSEMFEDPDEVRQMKIGDTISGMVVEPENDEGYVELSLREANRERTWQDLNKLKDSGEVVHLKILEANRGGLVVKMRGVMGFVPVSQLSPNNYPRVEDGDKDRILQALKMFIGQAMDLKIIDLDQNDQKLILSERMANSHELDQILSKYTIGDVVHGTITGVVDFGAFVKFDDQMEGLVHISEIDWQIVDDPKKYLKIGDKVDAKIIDIKNGRVSLSLKALKNNPWENIGQKYHKGDVITGEVNKINPFGAFVTVDDVQGLCHVTQFGSQEEMRAKLILGNSYTFKIVLLEPREYRMALELLDGKAEAEEKKSANAPADALAETESAAPVKKRSTKSVKSKAEKATPEESAE